MDHVTFNFNNNMSTAVVFLDIEKAFDTTWHLGLLYKLAKFSQRKSRVSVEGEICAPRDVQAGVPQASTPTPTLHSIHMVACRPVARQ
jgi:hypothetical protein